MLWVEELHSSPRPWGAGAAAGLLALRRRAGHRRVRRRRRPALRPGIPAVPGRLPDLLGRAYAARLDRAGELAHEGETDASALVLTLSTPDGVRTTRVTAPDAGGGDRDRINDFVQALPAAPAAAAAYRPAAIAMLAVGGVGTDSAARPWPSAPLDQGIRTDQGRCAVVRDAGPIQGVRQEQSRWSSGGRVYTVLGRPLLPEEHDCPDIDR